MTPRSNPRLLFSAQTRLKYNWLPNKKENQTAWENDYGCSPSSHPSMFNTSRQMLLPCFLTKLTYSISAHTRLPSSGETTTGSFASSTPRITICLGRNLIMNSSSLSSLHGRISNSHPNSNSPFPQPPEDLPRREHATHFSTEDFARTTGTVPTNICVATANALATTYEIATSSPSNPRIHRPTPVRSRILKSFLTRYPSSKKTFLITGLEYGFRIHSSISSLLSTSYTKHKSAP